MAYIAQSHVAIGDTWSAASHNTMIDNIASIYASNGTMGSAITALQASDITLSGLISAISGLPAGGTAYQGLRVNSGASAKEWAALFNLHRRQGGSATDWSSQGTTAYTPAHVLAQIGALTISMTGSPMTGSGTVTFPVAFSQPPLVFVTSDVMASGGVFMQYGHTGVTAAGFTVWCSYNANSTYGNRTVSWMALGPA